MQHCSSSQLSAGGVAPSVYCMNSMRNEIQCVVNNLPTTQANNARVARTGTNHSPTGIHL